MDDWGLVVMYALGGVTGLFGGWLAWHGRAPRYVPPSNLHMPVFPQRCWCAACDAAQSQFRFRLNLCPECGDKRCPRAEHHSNECSKTPNVTISGRR